MKPGSRLSKTALLPTFRAAISRMLLGRRHRTVLAALGGRCPCCGVARVLDDDGRGNANEWHHFYSRERRTFEEVWLVRQPCHLCVVDRTKFGAVFEAYQQRAESLEARQLPLFA